MSTEEPGIIVAPQDTGAVKKCSEGGCLTPLDEETPEDTCGATEKQIKELLATIDVLANQIVRMRKL